MLIRPCSGAQPTRVQSASGQRGAELRIKAPMGYHLTSFLELMKVTRSMMTLSGKPCLRGFRTTACRKIGILGDHAPSVTSYKIPSPCEKTKLVMQQDLFCSRIEVSNKRPIVFTTLLTAAGFVIAAVATNYETAKWQRRVVFDPYPKIREDISWMELSYSLQMYSEWVQDGIRRAQAYKKKLSKSLPEYFTPEDAVLIERLYDSVATWWLNLLEGQQICRELALGLVAVHFLRQTPSMKSFVTRYFTHNPWSGRVLTLFTNQLSHSGWLHLCYNVIKLLGVGELTWYNLRHKQTKPGERLYEALSGYHFLAFYFAAGSVASLSSHIWLTRWQSPAITRVLLCPKIGSKSVPETINRASGSSGALSANVTMFALDWADLNTVTVRFPSTEMTATPVFLGFLIADIYGLRRGWRKIDHAAHIGGAAFGAAYYYLGPPTWDLLRRATDLRRE